MPEIFESIKVVRGGKVVKKSNIHKSHKPRSAKQKLAMKKMQMKSHSASANKNRAKSMTVRAKKGLDSVEMTDSKVVKINYSLLLADAGEPVKVFLSRNETGYLFEFDIKDQIINVSMEDSDGALSVLKDMGIDKVGNVSVDKIISGMQVFGSEYPLSMNISRLGKVKQYF